MKKVNVGHNEPKKVSTLNNFLFLVGRQLFEDNQNLAHMGWGGLSSFVDWIEDNYDLIPKDGKDELVDFPKVEKFFDGYMGGIPLSNRRPTGAVLTDDNDIVVSFEDEEDETTNRYRNFHDNKLQDNVDVLNVLIKNTK